MLANAIVAFRHAPDWGGVLAFHEFAFGTVALKPTPWGIVPKGEWTDHEDRLAFGFPIISELRTLSTRVLSDHDG
ncbi:MAG TPA: hypothetical protein VKB88_16280 [Bryobacteraceae bacterium]|nr:hypothetical protein [Bryobacteraceae bacterium]